MDHKEIHEKLKQMFPDVAVPANMPEDFSEGIRNGGKIRRIVVDRLGCIGARSCVFAAPGIFQMDDTNLAYVTNADGEDEDSLLMAAQSCPTLAISLYDENGNKIFPEE